MPIEFREIVGNVGRRIMVREVAVRGAMGASLVGGGLVLREKAPDIIMTFNALPPLQQAAIIFGAGVFLMFFDAALNRR